MFRVGLGWIISRREVGGKNSLHLEMKDVSYKFMSDVPLGVGVKVGVAPENSAGLWKPNVSLM